MVEITTYLWHLARMLFFILINIFIVMLICGFIFEFITCTILSFKEFIDKLRK
nr:MAG TPA: hypothetical protein [Caudoviricetes sp.]